MLTPEQLDRLNAAIRQAEATDNPLARLMQASKQAGINFQDVLEHLIVQAVKNAYHSECMPVPEP